LEVILETIGSNYVPSATHDNSYTFDAPRCHPGTRESFLRRLSSWVQDAESSVYVSWLHGPAGAGKSAIARSLAEILDAQNVLAGSFFLFRTDSRRNSLKSLVMTLAYQIARSIPDTLPSIARALENDPLIGSRSLQKQFDALIVGPLVHTNPSEPDTLSRPLLIIIDGLDECHDHKERILALNIMFDALPHLHGRIKFLVVSRPEYDIERSFESAARQLEPHINIIGLLGDLQAYDDVRIYLCDSFVRIKQMHPHRKHFTSGWPSDDAIDKLVEKSSGHFIYASTVVKYIENDFDNPQKCLDIVINLRPTSRNPYAALDALYLSILSSSRTDHTLLGNIFSIVTLDGQFCTKLTRDIGRLKSDRFMECVLLLNPGELRLALLDLKSLVGLSIPSYSTLGFVEFWHKSFSDFLLDPSRSGEFYSSSARACTAMAKSCLQLLSDGTELLVR